MSSRCTSLLAGVLAVAFSVCAALFAWLVGGLNCDDVCDASRGSWTGTGDAPQWTSIMVLGAALFVLSIVVACSAAGGRRALAWLATFAWTACGVQLVVLLDEAQGDGATYRNLLLLGIVCVVAAALFAEPARTDRPG